MNCIFNAAIRSSQKEVFKALCLSGGKMFRILFRYIIYILLFGAGSLWADDNVWTTNGPYGGSVKTIAFHPYDQSIIYIGTIQDGVYKTLDGGQHWTRCERREMTSCMRVVAVHPIGPDTVFAATVNGAYKSVDAGQTWFEMPSPHYTEYRGFLIHPAESNILFADRFKSTDGGLSWFFPTNWQYFNREWITADPLNPDIIYIASCCIESDRAVWKSNDGGESWINIDNDLTGHGYGWHISVHPVNDNIIFYSTSDDWDYPPKCLWKSTNAGTNWTDITPPGLHNPHIYCSKVSPYYDNSLFVCTSTIGVQKSADLGLTYEGANDSLRVLCIATIEFPRKEGIMLGTYDDGIWRSTNNGEHWENMSTGICAAYCSDLAIYPSEPATIFAAAANGLFQSTDGGQNWRYIKTGASLHTAPGAVEINKYHPNIIYMANYWKDWTMPDSTGFFCSVDGGFRWEFLSNGLPESLCYFSMALSYQDSTTQRIFLGSSRGLYYSDNSGASWDVCLAGLPVDNKYVKVEVAPSDPDVIAVADIYDRLYLSHDRGATWSRSESLPTTPFGDLTDIAFDPFNSDHIYTAVNYMGLFETRDGGLNWTKISPDLPVDSTRIYISGILVNPLNPQSMFVHSARYGIFASGDGGRHWASFNAGFDTTIGGVSEFLFIPGDTTYLVLATYTRSVWTMHRTITDIADARDRIPSEIELSSYPNPFNAETKISFVIPSKAAGYITIFDLTGKVIRKFADLKERSIVWDGTDTAGKKVASGIYFVRLRAGTEKSIKITLLK
jgi:photosystem II stability/assembly factor-like uncharacterized protein